MSGSVTVPGDDSNGKTSKIQSADNGNDISRKAIELSKLILAMTTHTGSGHPSTCLSLVHIITTLMYKIMKYDPQNPWNPLNDRLILSEGHAVPVVYAAYADLHGVYGSDPLHPQQLTIDDLYTLRQINSPLDGHPNPETGIPFFDCASGSLGQGLSCACGIMLSARLQKIDKRAFVVIGDGEGREGQIWEACDFIVDNNLYEIIPILNCNGLGQTGKVSPQQSAEKYAEKLKAFGFHVIAIDGHDPALLLKTFRKVIKQSVPTAIIARTVKGWGVELLQGNNSHGKPLKETDLNEVMSHLNTLLPADQAGITRNGVHLHLSKQRQKTIEPRKPVKIDDPDFELLLDGDLYLEMFRKGLMSTRRAFGLALREMGSVNPFIVCLDADVNNSTFTNYFAKSFPERFFQCGIAEQNMMSIASGLASTGYIPVVTTFAKFMVRTFDQLELALIGGAPVKLCGSHAGVNIGADGPSQMGVTDMGYMRTLSTVTDNSSQPLMTIFNPSCAIAAYKCFDLMIGLPGACYMRTIRQDLPIIYKPDEQFEPGGVKCIIEGKDIAILTSGYMVHACRKVVEELQEAGVHVSLYDCYSLPIKHEIVNEAAEQNNGKIITVEDNYGNALGSEVASILALNDTLSSMVRQLFVKRIPKSGITAEDVLDFVGIGV